MSLSRRAGFSLVEVLVALVLGGILLTLTFELIEHAFRVERSRGERAGLAAGLRAGAGLLEHELAGLGADSLAGADLVAVGPGSARFRAPRGLWVVCRVAADTLVVAADTGLRWGARLPAPGRDSLLLYLPGDSTAVIDAWLALPVASGPWPASCPGGGTGYLLETVLDSTALARYRIPPTTVARLVETVEIRAYQSAGRWYLGLELVAAGAAIQPFVGPLAGGGFDLAPLDAFGNPTAPARAVAAAVRLAGVTDRQNAAGLGARSAGGRDSLPFRARFRNVP